MRILLVEPFHGGSHRAWAEGYADASGHEVVLVTHPGERWRWRLRGASFTLADDIDTAVAAAGPPDVVLVSSMVDVPALLGFARESIGGAPVAVYVHESQLLYTETSGRLPDRQAVITNWLSLAAADLSLFNSAFHRDALFEALPSFLGEVADHRHLDRLAGVRGRSEVLSVGVDLAPFTQGGPGSSGGSPLVSWNHRWEWDKQPTVFLRALVDLAEAGVDFRVALAGERTRRSPEDVALLERLGERVVVDEFLTRAAYHDLLGRTDVVVSTATQEFFGIAMVEAMAAGCVPVLPRALSYPEIVPEAFHHSLYETEDGPLDHLRRVLDDLPAARRATDGLAAAMQRFDWSVMAARYDERLQRVVDRTRR